ncbi:MAG: sulfurtransferase [Proteobacteria bacterium]|nr:MAG: sulfurtransferase [Pseudomonadota bacterium]
MNIDKMVQIMAGSVILISLLLAVYVNINWLWLTAFVGVNLVQSAFTGFCPSAIIFKKLGFKSGASF